MFLQLAHTKLDVFHQSQLLALECYKITKLFPHEERFALGNIIIKTFKIISGMISR
jgi:hypothetical protein